MSTVIVFVTATAERFSHKYVFKRALSDKVGQSFSQALKTNEVYLHLSRNRHRICPIYVQKLTGLLQCRVQCSYLVFILL